MPPTIVSPADCEVRAVIRFLSAKGVKPIDIQREICEVYGKNMSDGMVRKWMRAFQDGRTNVHDEERSGRLSVVNEDLVQKVDEKMDYALVEMNEPEPMTLGNEINSILQEAPIHTSDLDPVVANGPCPKKRRAMRSFRSTHSAGTAIVDQTACTSQSNPAYGLASVTIKTEVPDVEGVKFGAAAEMEFVAVKEELEDSDQQSQEERNGSSSPADVKVFAVEPFFIKEEDNGGSGCLDSHASSSTQFDQSYR